MQTLISLRKCPFCGCDKIISHESVVERTDYLCSCECALCHMRGPECSNDYEARLAWNELPRKVTTKDGVRGGFFYNLIRRIRILLHRGYRAMALGGIDSTRS